MRKRSKSTKKYLLIIIPLVAVAVGVGAFSYSSGESKQKVVFDDPMKLMLGGSPMLGAQNAPLTLVEFGDYQCTYCHRFHTDTKESIMNNYVNSGKIKFFFRDFPLNGPVSVLAAEAAYCADEQNRYWAYHDEVYNNWNGENTGWVTISNLEKFASNVGLDVGAFDKCVQSDKYKQRVLDNYSFGQSLGINATPTFLLIDSKGNVQPIVGAQPYGVFEQALDEKLRSTKA